MKNRIHVEAVGWHGNGRFRFEHFQHLFLIGRCQSWRQRHRTALNHKCIAIIDHGMSLQNILLTQRMPVHVRKTIRYATSGVSTRFWMRIDFNTVTACLAANNFHSNELAVIVMETVIRSRKYAVALFSGDVSCSSSGCIWRFQVEHPRIKFLVLREFRCKNTVM